MMPKPSIERMTSTSLCLFEAAHVKRLRQL